MIEVVVLAIALSMDAFAVSVGLGTKRSSINIALKAGFLFGFFQALMPLLGYWGGRSVFGWLQEYTGWVAFGLLAAIGLKMIRDSFSGEEKTASVASNRVLVLLAIATSIDAMAAGFSLALLQYTPYVACLIIGVITFIFSVGGVLVGRHGGARLGDHAELFGGIVLILLGVKFLAF